MLEDNDTLKDLESSLVRIFKNYAANSGFKKAIDYLDFVYDDDTEMSKNNVILSLADDVQFLTPKEVHKIIEPILEHFDGMEKIISADTEKQLIFLLYKRIRNNYNLPQAYINKIQYDLIKSLTSFYSNDTIVNDIKLIVICRIYVEFALIKADDALFSDIIYLLHTNNLFSNDDYFLTAISFLTLSLYSFCYREWIRMGSILGWSLHLRPSFLIFANGIILTMKEPCPIRYLIKKFKVHILYVKKN